MVDIGTAGLVGIGLGALGAGVLLAWLLLRRKTFKSLTSHVLVEEDEEMIEAELAELDKLAGSVSKLSKEQATAKEEGDEKEKSKAEPEKPAEKKPAKKEEKETAGQNALKKVLTAARKTGKPVKKSVKQKKTAEKAAPKKKEEKKAEKKEEKKQAKAAKATPDDNFSKDENQQYTSMRNMIAKANLLLRKKQNKRAYVLYLKIRREYTTLPKKIKMKIKEEYNGMRSGINRTIPELEVVDEMVGKDAELAGQTEMEIQAKFLTLLDQAEDSLKMGEKEKAYILYSEIRGMYHIIPEAIKKEVYRRCVDIYDHVRAGDK